MNTFFHPRDGPDLPQQLEIVLVAGGPGWGRGWGPGRRGACTCRFSCCCWQEGWRKLAVGPPMSWTIALELGVMGEALHLFSTLSWLREVTIRPWWKAREQKLHPPKHPRLWATEKRHLLDGRHAPLLVVHGVDLPGEGQGVHRVQFLLVQGHGWRVHHQAAAAVGLEDGLPPDGVMLLVLDFRSQGVVVLVRTHPPRRRAPPPRRRHRRPRGRSRAVPRMSVRVFTSSPFESRRAISRWPAPPCRRPAGPPPRPGGWSGGPCRPSSRSGRSGGDWPPGRR